MIECPKCCHWQSLRVEFADEHSAELFEEDLVAIVAAQESSLSRIYWQGRLQELRVRPCRRCGSATRLLPKAQVSA